MTRILVADEASVEELTSILRHEEFLVDVAGISRGPPGAPSLCSSARRSTSC